MKKATEQTKVLLPPSSMLPVWRTIDRAMITRLSKWGIPVSVAAAVLHVYVHPEDAEPARLAEAIYMPRQSMSFTLDVLERLSLASRAPHPDDRRKKQIVLSVKGKALAKEMLEDLLRFEASAFAAFPPDECLQLKTLCEKLARILTDLNRTS